MWGIAPWVVVAIALSVFVGAWVQSIVGLGIGLVAAPVVAATAPELMPQLALWIALGMAVVSLAGERRHVDWRAIGWAVPGRLPGTALGVWLVLRFDSRVLGIAVAVMVLFAVAVSLRPVVVPMTPSRLLVAGFTSAVTGTTTSIGGPPMALMLRGREPEVIRSTLAVFFTIGASLSLTGLAIGGSLDLLPAAIGAALMPVVLLGLAVGTRQRARLAGPRFRVAVLGVCALSALVLLVRSLV